MIAICSQCRRTVTPEPPIIGQNLPEVMRLVAGMQAHLLETHAAEAATSYMAGMNAHSLFIMQQFTCTDPEYSRIVRESLTQLSSMIAAFTRAVTPPPVRVVKP